MSEIDLAINLKNATWYCRIFKKPTYNDYNLLWLINLNLFPEFFKQKLFLMLVAKNDHQSIANNFG